MLRSRRCVFLSHCMLAQMVRAKGLARHFPASVRPVIQFCLDNEINMVQMPCPESRCAAGGLGRDPHGKAWYEKNGLRDTCKSIAIGQVAYMRELMDHGVEVMAVIAVDLSPACAVNYLNRGASLIRDSGIFIEELKSEMQFRGVDVPFLGVNERWLKKLARELTELNEQSSNSTLFRDRAQDSSVELTVGASC